MDNSEFELEAVGLKEIEAEKYDLTIYALGYEIRALELLKIRQSNNSRSIAFGFDYGRELSFEENRGTFIKYDVSVKLDLSDQQFQHAFEQELNALAGRENNEEPIKLLVDISCFNRSRLATVIYSISKLSEVRLVIVDFFYAIAHFNPPSTARIANSVVDAVHPSFAGWSRIPANPTAAVIGLGYEQGQALGAVEYLQANPVWAYSPISAEVRYADAVTTANKLLIDELSSGNIIQYKVEKPLETFREIEGLARGLLQDYNVVLVPFGPKIFVLLALLTAWRHRSVAVWRVSPGDKIEPAQREASGYFSTVRITAKKKQLE